MYGLKYGLVVFAALTVSVLVGLTACQVAPTRITETSNHEVQRLVEKASRKLSVTDETQIIDVRSSFEYSMMHLPNSVNLNPDHFVRKEGALAGQLEDSQSIIRRLALKGLHPEKPVIVVGEGLNGNSEEGRFAWMLIYLGYNDVQTASIALFQKALSNIESAPQANIPVWEPELREGLKINRTQLIEALKRRVGGEKVYVIDVREQQEYFAKKGFGEAYNTPDLQALNISWREFYNAEGRPNLSIKSKLLSIGIKPGDQVVVISNQGARSGSVTWALLALGFHRATNFAPGYQGLSK